MVKLFEASAVAQWFYQLCALYYQDVPKILIWYLDAFQNPKRRPGVQGGDYNILNHDLDSDGFFWKM